MDPVRLRNELALLTMSRSVVSMKTVFELNDVLISCATVEASIEMMATGGREIQLKSKVVNDRILKIAIA